MGNPSRRRAAGYVEGLSDLARRAGQSYRTICFLIEAEAVTEPEDVSKLWKVLENDRIAFNWHGERPPCP